MDYQDPDWVAERLGIDKNTVYRFLQDGTIPALQLGRKWLISQRRLEEWLAAETDKQTRARRDAAKSAESVVRRMDNFTAPAREALKKAHGEARQYAHEKLDQGHLLLALAADAKSPAARALRTFAITSDVVRRAIEAKMTPGDAPPPRRLSRTPEAKRAMRMASRLALREGAGPLSPVGTDHLLMGILLARRGIGHDVLVSHDATRHRLRDALRAAWAKANTSTDTKETEHDA
jgi:excisionase family DNA binding protein